MLASASQGVYRSITIVQIVLEREVNGVLQADAQLAILDHLLDARCIRQDRLRHRRGGIGRNDIGEPSLAVRIILI